MCGLTALWLDFSHLQRLQQADAIVPVLASLYAWTPYYWESNRFGQLVPLLAMPFHNPLTNLLVQYAINLSCLVASLFLIARYAIAHKGWPLSAAMALAILFSFAQPQLTFDAAFQPWIIGACFGVGALILLEPLSEGRWIAWRIVTAGVLFAIAQWVNLAAVATVLPLACMRFLLAPGDRRLKLRELWVGAGLVVAALIASVQICIRASHQDTYIGVVLPTLWPSAFQTLGRNLFVYGVGSGDGVGHEGAAWLWVAIGAGALGLCFRATALRRTDADAGLRGFISVLASALAFWIFLATQTHIQFSGYASRYMVPVAMMLLLAFCALLGPPLARTLSERGLPIVCAALLLIGSAVGFGAPSLDGVRADLTEKFGQSTDALLGLTATHLAGSYFSVWPAVWHANWALYRAGEPRHVWGVTPRAAATLSEWSTLPERDFRVVVESDDLVAGHKWVTTYKLPPLRQAGRRGTLTLYVPLLHP